MLLTVRTVALDSQPLRMTTMTVASNKQKAKTKTKAREKEKIRGARLARGHGSSREIVLLGESCGIERCYLVLQQQLFSRVLEAKPSTF